MTHTPTEMELRVAKALEPGFFAEHEQVYEPRYYKELQDVALGNARAAIRAMRSPTTEMKVACVNAVGRFESTAEISWQAMIDAASPPEGS